MESEARYALVGAFVVVSAIVFVAAVLWLSDLGGAGDVKHYTVYFRRYSLAGLQKDSDVTMKGIKVGSVADYQMSPQSVEEVKVDLVLDEGVPVKLDTEAVIKRNLLTGIAWVDLVGSSKESPPRLQVPSGEEYPIIPEGRTEFDAIADSIPGMMELVGETAGRASELLSTENLELMQQILENVAAVTGSLRENSDRLQSFIEHLDEVAKEVSKLSKDLQRLASTTDRTLSQVQGDASKALSAIEESSRTFTQQAVEMKKSVESASIVFAQEVSVVAQSISEASETFRKAIEGFENPRAIITGPSKGALGPGERIAQ